MDPYYAANKERLSAKRKAAYPARREAIIRQSRGWYAQNRQKVMLRQAATRAKKQGIAFSLTLADLQRAWPVDDVCPVLGIPFAPPPDPSGPSTKQGPKQDSPTLDRVRPEAGYVAGNVIVISWRANRIKHDASPEELLAVAKWALAQTAISDKLAEMF